MKTGRNSNRGFSLVELVIVIAIMAIVSGLATLSVSIITNKKVSKCADEIVSTMERARVLTLGKAQNNVECIIYQDGESYIAQIIQGGSVVSEREIGKTPIKITVYFDSGAGVDISAVNGKSPAGTGNGLHVIFDRASGAFVADVNAQGKYCTKIEVTNGKRTVNILPVGRTGKISKE
jgi:prepilin-type N-terminal cleavage/methylation domain-containing protein